MRRQIAIIGLVLTFMLLPASLQALKIVSWNALDFQGALSTDRIADYKTVLDELQPDILVLQDVADLEGADKILKQALNHTKALYKRAKFTNQDGTATAFYYNKKTIKLTSQEEIQTLNRSVWGYTVKIKKGDGKGNTLYVYSAHLPDGTNTAAKNLRDADVELLRTHLDMTHQPGDFFVVCGTFNLSGTKDKAFKILTADGASSNGRLVDPLDLKGRWHNKKKHQITFSRSTRLMDAGVGASGGLKDRYDNFFISQGLVDDESFTYREGSYIAYGNDGKHFKKAVTVPDNEIVPQDSADALYRASDHLPIVMVLGPPAGDDPPLPPSQLTAQAFSASGVNLAWTDNASNEDGFHLARARDCFDCHGSTHCNACHGGFPGLPTSPSHDFSGHTHSWAKIATIAPDVQSFADSGLASGAKYSYKVRAYNAKGNSAYSNTATVTTAAASAKDEDK
jgi:endonuclease/exonuclease/phosphatase family metal-dependent hydrolase